MKRGTKTRAADVGDVTWYYLDHVGVNGDLYKCHRVADVRAEVADALPGWMAKADPEEHVMIAELCRAVDLPVPAGLGV
jgi:hypothetical protein